MLTIGEVSVIVIKLSASGRASAEGDEKTSEKKKKVLTKRDLCGNLSKLSARAVAANESAEKTSEKEEKST